MDTVRSASTLDRESFERALDLYSSQRRKLPPAALRSVASEVLQQLSRRLQAESLPAGSPTDEALDQFCDALIGDDDLKGREIIAEARAGGVSMDAIYLGYLAEAARRLGERWDQDEATFWQMTLASGRVYAIMRGLRHHFAPKPFDVRRHALFTTIPGDQHTLGVSIAADLFRSQGWDIELQTPSSQQELVEAVEQSDHLIIGVSASTASQLADLAKLVVALRLARPYGHIIVSGHIVNEEPDVMDLVDADGFAGSAPGAIEKLERLIADQRRTG